MRPGRPELLCDPVLIDAGVVHGFGRRGARVPEQTRFPRQVHGTAVWLAESVEEVEPPEADAVVGLAPGPPVGIVTADCVPILAASEEGSAVVAIHAGWRGLAAGVIEEGLTALRERAARPGALWAAIGPAARGCCYEVDEPVRDALARRYRAGLGRGVLKAGRAGHYQLDLPLLAEQVLLDCGVESPRLGTTHRVCTICDADRFESYRRDGAAAGRLAHFIAASAGARSEG